MKGDTGAPTPLRDRILARVDAVDWAAIPGDEWYRPEKVPRAFRRLFEVTDEKSGWTAQSNLLYSFGNNHSGNYYPAAVFAVPIVVEVAQEAEGWVLWTVLEALLDLAWCFDPSQDTFFFNGQNVQLEKEVLAVLMTAAPRYEALINDLSQPEDIRYSAGEALKGLSIDRD